MSDIRRDAVGEILNPALLHAHNRGALQALRLAGEQCNSYADKVVEVLGSPDFRDELCLEARGEIRAARFLAQMFLRIADECEHLA